MDGANVVSARQQVELARQQLEILIAQPVQELAAVDTARLPLLPPGLLLRVDALDRFWNFPARSP